MIHVLRVGMAPMCRWRNGSGAPGAKRKNLRKKGRPASPVTVEGRTIAKTFWGKAWCDNLERYSDFAEPIAARTFLRAQRLCDRSRYCRGRGQSPGLLARGFIKSP